VIVLPLVMTRSFALAVLGEKAAKVRAAVAPIRQKVVMGIPLRVMGNLFGWECIGHSSGPQSP
jgi:hypothetical protein